MGTKNTNRLEEEVQKLNKLLNGDVIDEQEAAAIYFSIKDKESQSLRNLLNSGAIDEQEAAAIYFSINRGTPTQ